MNSSGLQTRLAHTVYIFLCIYLWFPRWRQLVINFWLFAAVLAIKKCKRIFQRLLKQLRPVASKLGQESRFYRHLSVRLTSETNLLRSRGYARRAFQFVFLPSKPFFSLKYLCIHVTRRKTHKELVSFPPDGSKLVSAPLIDWPRPCPVEAELNLHANLPFVSFHLAIWKMQIFAMEQQRTRARILRRRTRTGRTRTRRRRRRQDWTEREVGVYTTWYSRQVTHPVFQA